MKRSPYQRLLLRMFNRSNRRRRDYWRHDHVDVGHTLAGRFARWQLRRTRKPLRVYLFERGWFA